MPIDILLAIIVVLVIQAILVFGTPIIMTELPFRVANKILLT